LEVYKEIQRKEKHTLCGIPNNLTDGWQVLKEIFMLR